MNSAVAGTGYVGLSLATLLSQKNEVVALDVIEEKVEMINNRISPIKDEKIEEFFKTKDLNLKATLDFQEAFQNADFVIISTWETAQTEANASPLKPSEDIFNALFEKYNLKAEECVFFDDKLKNVNGAKKTGMHGFVFEGYEKACRDLEDLVAKLNK